MIRAFLAGLICLLGLALPVFAQSREIYTVKGINVDTSASSVLAAQQQAFASAKQIGWQRLIARLTLPEDRARLAAMNIMPATIETLAVAVDVEEETRGAGRYRGRLAVVFNPAKVRTLLTGAGLAFLDRQGPLTVIIPLASDASQLPAWQTAWPDKSDGYLVPTYTNRDASLTNVNDWTSVSSAASLFGAQRAIVATLNAQASGFSVSLRSITASGSLDLGRTASFASLEECVRAASELLDMQWKQSAIVRDANRVSVEATVTYTSLAEWNTLRGALIRSPLISNFRTKAISRDGAAIEFSLAGDTARLSADLRDRGVVFAQKDIGLVLNSAISPAPAAPMLQTPDPAAGGASLNPT